MRETAVYYLLPEVEKVRRWRYEEARDAGLSRTEAKLFSESDIDVGRLRALVDHGATPAQVAAILL